MTPLAGTLQEPEVVKLSTTTVTDVLSVAAGTSNIVSVIGALIVNQDTTARKVTLFLTKDTTDYAVFENTVGANESVAVTFEAPIRLYAKSTARKIRAQAAAANVVTVTVISTSSQQQVPNAG